MQIKEKKITYDHRYQFHYLFMLKGQNSSYLIAVNISNPVSLFIYLFIF
jgi:heme-binding NEAT domain protein